MNTYTTHEQGSRNPALELFDNRQINIFGPVDTNLANAVISQAMVLESRDANEPITVNVMGPGGDVYAGLAIIDALRALRCPVRTVAIGLVASMSAVIAACAASEGERYCLEHTEYMLHQVMSSASGQQTDVQVAAEHLAALRGRLDKLLAEATGLKVAKVHAMTERDTWLDAKAAFKAGLVDSTIAPTSQQMLEAIDPLEYKKTAKP